MIDPAISPTISSAVILSPHRDDAAFSCGILMTLLLQQRVAVTILNIFTVSHYAPCAPASTHAGAVTAIRRSEDDALLRHLGPGAHLLDLAELDAPLRLRISEYDVLDQSLPPTLFRAEVHKLVPLLRPLADFNLVLLPLALGGHIDHLVAREAGRLAAPTHRTGFYEDLPYAARLDTSASHVRQHHLASLNFNSLEPLIVATPNAVTLKHNLASLYPSQIPQEVALEIGAYAHGLGGAERIYSSSDLIQTIRETLGLKPATKRVASQRGRSRA